MMDRGRLGSEEDGRRQLDGSEMATERVRMGFLWILKHSLNRRRDPRQH